MIWLIVEALEVELEDASIRQLPKSWMHFELESIDPLVSEATLVSLLASVALLLGLDSALNSFVDDNQILGNVSLGWITEV